MTGRMTGKVVIVTGGALGIGLGIVRRFVQEGAGVLLVDLNEKAAQAAAEKLAGGPGRVEVYPADVAAEDTGERVVARCVRPLAAWMSWSIMPGSSRRRRSCR